MRRKAYLGTEATRSHIIMRISAGSLMNNSNFLNVKPVIDGSRSIIKGGKRESSQPTLVLVFDLFETATSMRSRENLLHSSSISVPAAKVCTSACATISSIRFIAEMRSLYDHVPRFVMFEEMLRVEFSS